MKTAPFKLRSGNKPEVAKMMGVSPAKERSEAAKNLLKAVPDKEAYDKLSPEDQMAFNKAAKKAGLPTKPAS